MRFSLKQFKRINFMQTNAQSGDILLITPLDPTNNITRIAATEDGDPSMLGLLLYGNEITELKEGSIPVPGSSCQLSTVIDYQLQLNNIGEIEPGAFYYLGNSSEVFENKHILVKYRIYVFKTELPSVTISIGLTVIFEYIT